MATAAPMVLGCSGDPADPPMDFDLPQVVNRGGPVLAAPQVQPIYLPGFPYQRDMDTLLARLPASAYWRQVGAEYGLGPAIVLPGAASAAGVASVVDADGAAALLAD